MTGFGWNNPKVVNAPVVDPTASGTIALFKAPTSTGGSVTLKSAAVISDTALAAGTNGREVRLLDGGATGTGAVALTPWLGTATAGTYSAWVANTARVLTLGTATVGSGSYVMLEYKKTATDSWKNMTCAIEYHDGTSS